MKKLIFGLMALTSLTAFTGTHGLPEQDPVVKNLRERFKDAVVPDIHNLLGKKFECLTISATKDHFYQSKYTTKMSFRSFDGLVIMEDALTDTVLASNGKELTGNYGLFTEDPNLYSIRETSSGDLIIEETQDDPGLEKVAAKAISNGGKGRALVYEICQSEVEEQKQIDFRCQLAQSYCGYNGGRYGVWIKAINVDSAVQKCILEANSRRDHFCQVTK